MKTRVEKTVAKGQVMRTETGRDRSDSMPNSEALMGKPMRDTGVTHSIKGNMVPKDSNVRGK